MEKFMAALSRLKWTPKILIIRMRFVMTIDASGIRLLTDLLDQTKRNGTLLLISGLREDGDVYQSLEKAGLLDKIGKDHVFPKFLLAVDYAKEKLNPLFPANLGLKK